MKKYFRSILLLILLIPLNSNSQWYIQYQTSINFLNDVRFIDRYTGWACGDNSILKTTNGGINWIPQNAHGYLTQIHPVNDSVAYVCGEYIIMKTTNGGDNWITLREGTNLVPLLNGLWFNNKNTGWFCGRAVTMRTTDGGNTFIDSMYVPNTLNDVHFKNDSVGVIAAWSKTYRTTNSGENWYPVQLPSSLETPFTERLTFQGDTGWTVTWGGTIFKTTNYGVSWDSIVNIPFGGSARAYSIEFSSFNIGYCGGDAGKIFKSTNGGFHWTSQISVGGPFSSIYSYNDSIVWAVNGDIYNTVTGGLTNILFENIIGPDNYKLYQNYPNPFNPNTNIQYDLPIDNFVSIKVYDLIGKEVLTLVNEFKQAGSYIVSFNVSNLSTGIYYYHMVVHSDKIKAGNFEQVRKMILIK
ncbi:MAG: YCF48-related protein [Ignavibacteria bacterium]